MAAAPAWPQAIIDNGTVQLGVNAHGQLNLEGGTPSSGEGTTFVGLRFVPTNAEATAPGCLCEGWGAADATSGVFGAANRVFGPPENMSLISFTVSGAGTQPESSGNRAVSVVDIGTPPILRVTQDYHPSPTPSLYEVTVTIQNLSAAPISPRYRRAMDWDTEPTAFSELVTIEIGSAANLLASSDNGFATSNPLGGEHADIAGCGLNTSFVDCGPADHGALFDFGFDPLAPGASLTFNIYYGATPDESTALAALSLVAAEVYSLGQPNVDPVLGIPNTFVFAFAGVGGEPVLPQCTLEPASATNPVGTSHAVQATVTAGGNAVPGLGVDFDVVSGPHAGASGSGTTNAEGQASFAYTGTAAGEDAIEASGTFEGAPFACRATKTWTARTDTTRPSCRLTANLPGPPAQLQVTVQDTGSGLAEIVVTRSENADTVVPPFTVGSDDPLIVTSTKIDQTKRARLEMRVTDVAGNVTLCDPISTDLVRAAGKPVSHTFADVPQAEDTITIVNGNPGLTSFDIVVNGVRYKVAGLVAGEELTLDVANAMQPGYNLVSLTAYGKPGSWASLLIWEGED